jgi:hypothetical protein
MKGGAAKVLSVNGDCAAAEGAGAGAGAVCAYALVVRRRDASPLKASRNKRVPQAAKKLDEASRDIIRRSSEIIAQEKARPDRSGRDF